MPGDRSHALRKAITDESLRRLAGARSYARGREYFESGAVGHLVESGGMIEAEVSGTLDYRARLWLANGQLARSCTCPVGEDGVFCKHLVALGFACMTPSDPAGAKPARERTTSMDDVRADLADRSKEELVALLMEQAESHAPVRRRLETAAAARRGETVRLATFRKAIRDVTQYRGGFVSYPEAGGFARGIDEVIDSIARLNEDGQAETTVEISEYALAAVEKAMDAR